MLEPESEETKDLEKKIYNKDWDWYRLGDTYYRPEGANDLTYHVDKFPDSIASEYIKQSSSRSNDLDTIKKIIKKEPAKYETVIHIRIGDVICYGMGSSYSAYENKEWWEQLAKYLNQNDIKSVYIIAGSHTSLCLDKSAQYVLNRIRFLKEKGFTVVYEPGKQPDEDLVIAANSKNFISTGGNYGKLMSEIVRTNGGNVITIKIEQDNLKYIVIYFIVNIVITLMFVLFFSYTKL